MREIAYSYDQNGVFVGVVKCQPCKRELGKWLLPAKATWLAPPEPVDEKSRVFNGSKWEYRDIPRVPVLVEPRVEKSVEVRDNPDLVRVLVENMRVDLEKRVFKAVGSKLESIEKSLVMHEEWLSRLQGEMNASFAAIEQCENRIDSVLVELGVIGTRIENISMRFETLLSEMKSVQDVLSRSEKDDDYKNEVAVVEPKVSKFKFWG